MNKRQMWVLKNDDGEYWENVHGYVSDIGKASLWSFKPQVEAREKAVPVVVTIKEGKLR